MYDVTLQMHRDAISRVTGVTLTRTDGEGISNQQVWDAGGTMRVRLPKGTYEVSVSMNGLSSVIKETFSVIGRGRTINLCNDYCDEPYDFSYSDGVRTTGSTAYTDQTAAQWRDSHTVRCSFDMGILEDSSVSFDWTVKDAAKGSSGSLGVSKRSLYLRRGETYTLQTRLKGKTIAFTRTVPETGDMTWTLGKDEIYAQLLTIYDLTPETAWMRSLGAASEWQLISLKDGRQTVVENVDADMRKLLAASQTMVKFTLNATGIISGRSYMLYLVPVPEEDAAIRHVTKVNMAEGTFSPDDENFTLEEGLAFVGKSQTNKVTLYSNRTCFRITATAALQGKRGI